MIFRSSYIICLSIILVLCALYVSAPVLAASPNVEWEHTYTGDASLLCSRFGQTSDGGYVIMGQEEDFTYTHGNHLFLIKTNASGYWQWARLYGTGDSSVYNGGSVLQASDGGYLITGHVTVFENKTWGPIGGGIYLVKADKDGNAQWEKTITDNDGDYGLYAIQDRSGDFIITGYRDSMNGTLFLARISPDGNVRWARGYSSGGEDYGNFLEQTKDRGYVITGFSKFGADKDVCVFKTDADGDLQWNHTFGGSYDDYGIGIEQTKDGGYLVTGSNCSYGTGGEYAYLIKLDASGNKQWETIGGTGNEIGMMASEHGDGYMVTGFTWDPSGDVRLIKKDLCFIMFNDSGGVQWERSLGMPINYTQTSSYLKGGDGLYVIRTSDGGYAIGGMLWNTDTYSHEDFIYKISKLDVSKLTPAPASPYKYQYTSGYTPRPTASTKDDMILLKLLRLFLRLFSR
jgi:hypothetical protein